jgi:hypothetical protein
VKDNAKEDELAQGRKKFREAAEQRQRQKEERMRAREEERQRKESQLATEKDLVTEENKAETPDTRRAEVRAFPSDLCLA